MSFDMLDSENERLGPDGAEGPAEAWDGWGAEAPDEEAEVEGLGWDEAEAEEALCSPGKQTYNT